MWHLKQRLVVFGLLSLSNYGTEAWWVGRRTTAARLRGRRQQQQQHVVVTTQLRASSLPKFSQSLYTRNDNNNKNQKHHPHQQPKFGADGRLASSHQRRIAGAGKIGTTRFVDPCKLFLGNLLYNVTDACLSQWLQDRMGLPAALLLCECHVVRDWQTSVSKGYGFVKFTEAHYATVCLETCQGRMLEGRPVSIAQGRRKPPEKTTLYVQRTNAAPLDAQEVAIQDGLREATAGSKVAMEPEEEALLRRLDPDLLEQRDNDHDVVLSDEWNDDDNDHVVVTGHSNIINTESPNMNTMNRAQRRKDGRAQKQKKAFKGFGA